MSGTNQELELLWSWFPGGALTFTLTKRELEEVLPFEPKVGVRVPGPIQKYNVLYAFRGTCVVEAVRHHEDGSVTIFAIHYPWVWD